MKKFLLTLVAVGISFATFAQGTINFNNLAVAAKVSRDTLAGPGAGAGITAQLALVSGGSLTLLTPTTTFRTGSAGQMFYVNAISSFVVPNTAANQVVSVRMLAWETSFGSYDAAKNGGGYSGFSNDINVTLGGPVTGFPDAFPGNLTGLQSFVITNVPEPTTLALLGLGGLALAIRRRK